MTTPQRALELADEKHDSIVALIHKSECQQLSKFEKARLDQLRDEERIFRHYAEIMQAEPVAWQFNSGWAEPKPENKYDYHEGNGRVLGGRPLIIKPEPLK